MKRVYILCILIVGCRNKEEYIQFNINNYEIYLQNRDDSDFGEVYGNLSTSVTYGKKPITINGIEKEQYYI